MERQSLFSPIMPIIILIVVGVMIFSFAYDDRYYSKDDEIIQVYGESEYVVYVFQGIVYERIVARLSIPTSTVTPEKIRTLHEQADSIINHHKEIHKIARKAKR